MSVLWLLFSVFLGQLNLIYTLCSMPCKGCQWQKSSVTKSLIAVSDRNRLLPTVSQGFSDRLIVCYQQSLRAISDRNGLLLPTVSQGCQRQKCSTVTKSLKAVSDSNGLLLPTVSQGCQWQTRRLLPTVSQAYQWQKWSAVTKSLRAVKISKAYTEVPTNQPGLGLVCDGVTHLLYVQDFRATVKGGQSWKAAATVTMFCGMVRTQPH